MFRKKEQTKAWVHWSLRRVNDRVFIFMLEISLRSYRLPAAREREMERSSGATGPRKNRTQGSKNVDTRDPSRRGHRQVAGHMQARAEWRGWIPHSRRRGICNVALTDPIQPSRTRWRLPAYSLSPRPSVDWSQSLSPYAIERAQPEAPAAF